MMRKNSSVDLSLFLLIAKIGKTRGLKGEFFLRSFAQNPEALFSFKKFYAISSSKMQEVQFEFMKQNNANIVEQKHKTKQTISDKSLQEIPCTPRDKSFYNHVFSFHLVQFAHSKVIQHPQKVIYKRSQTL